MKTGIIGAGFAGVAAAQVIAEAGVEVTLFSAEKVLPYHRPRLPEFAFAQEARKNMFFHPEEWYAQNGIDLRLDTRIKAFNSNFEVFPENGKSEKFDALLIATGAQAVIPPFTFAENTEKVLPLWTYADALKIRKNIKSIKHMAIIGGGLVGVESALRAEYNDLSITMIEKMPHVMSRYFGNRAGRIIEQKIHEHNINTVCNNEVCVIRNKNQKYFEINLRGGDFFVCDFVLVTVGAEFDVSVAAEAGLETGRQIKADNYLQTSGQGIFAAGDIAQFSRLRPCSGKEAEAQGKVAAHNILAYLNNGEFEKYKVKHVPVHLKYKSFSIYSVGKTPQIGRKEDVLTFDKMKKYRGVIYEKGAMVGIQAVDNEDGFLKEKKFLKDALSILSHKKDEK